MRSNFDFFFYLIFLLSLDDQSALISESAAFIPASRKVSLMLG